MTKKDRGSWTAVLSCVVAGMLLGFSQPFFLPGPVFAMSDRQGLLGLLSLFAYVPLFLAVAKRTLKATFLLSLLAMTLQFTVVFYWIYIALHEHGDVSLVPAAAITLLLPLVLAVKGSLFLTAGRFISQKFNISFLLLAPIALCASEYFRNFYIFGGFPWGSMGYSIARVDQFLQSASIIGVHGLVLVVGVSNSLFAQVLTSPDLKKRLSYLAGALSLISLLFIFGEWRLRSSENSFAPSIKVALLQGNIPQKQKREARLYSADIVEIYLDLFRQAKAQGAQLVIWPESSYPHMVLEGTSDFALKLEDPAATILGAVAYGEEENSFQPYVRNSAFFIDRLGQVIARYDKSHLVPFGEYVPWPMGGVVDKVVPGIGAFKPGRGFRPVDLPIDGHLLKVGATVCYEGSFPEISRAYAQRGAELLVNLTNDAWYGRSSAPYQHLLMYKLRSVESGRPFLRATNTGVSAVVDAHGRIKKTLGLFKRGVLIDDVPLLTKNTVYTAIGDVIPIACMVFLIGAYLMSVLPIIGFFRQRKWLELGLIASMVVLALIAKIYYSAPKFISDESARTKTLLIFLYCLLLMIGSLSRSRRSRSILMVCAAVTVFCSLALAILESVYFLFGLALGLLIYLLAFRIDGEVRKS